MCFGIRHAPLIFYKTLRPVLAYIKDILQISGVAYCDDLIFIHKDREVLAQKAILIVQLLEAFGFKIALEKSVLIPQ
jgi:UDP-N-acetylmuramyl pentapeptide phosphotransferase/UDP-N-acetylglucosamine-1-phosphate transferase